MTTKSWVAQLSVLSMSAHAKDNASYREQAALNPKIRFGLLKEWVESARKTNPRAGIFYLGTCHRVELYCFGVEVERILKEWKAMAGTAVDRFHQYQGEAALEHWIRVTSSLESEVLGETQITGQMKNAIEECREAQLLVGPLDRFAQRVLAAAKRLRTEIPFGEGSVSVAHVAVDGLLDFFDDLATKTALVVGAGSMAKQALERLEKIGVSQKTWINRSQHKIISDSLGRTCRIGAFEKLHEEIWKHSIVVVATSSHVRIIDKLKLHAARPSHFQGGPKVLLDLGLPRNVDSEIHGFEDFFVRDVDEFTNLAENNTKKRHNYMDLSSEMAREETLKIILDSKKWSRAPVIGEVVKLLEERKIADQSRLKLEKNQNIEYITGSIYSSLLHGILKEVENLDEEAAANFLEVLMRAWSRKGRWEEMHQKILLKAIKEEKVAQPLPKRRL